jgi:fructose-1,6-bisphosphatase/inositol monophosphatase family enzyme
MRYPTKTAGAVSDALDILLDTSSLAVGAIQRARGTAVTKGDRFVGHHAIVHPADYRAQTAILRTLHERYPDAYFITEETECSDKLAAKVLTRRNLLRHVDGHLFVIDPLDGSTQRDRNQYEWAVSIQELRDEKSYAAVIRAPAVLGGFTVYGAPACGVWYDEGDRPARRARVAPPRRLAERTVLFGADMPLEDWSATYGTRLSRKVRNARTIGSCALGLALVAAGKADAVVQPPQRIWDYAAGWSLVELAGGVVQFYVPRDDGPLFLQHGTDHYDPSTKMLGFIAGNERAVRSIRRLWKESL